jgi:hypothetical protein
MSVSVDGISPADLVREVLAAERARLEAERYPEYEGFWGCFVGYHADLLESLDDIDGDDAEAVREACWDSMFGWQSAISFGCYVEDVAAELGAAVTSRFLKGCAA